MQALVQQIVGYVLTIIATVQALAQEIRQQAATFVSFTPAGRGVTLGDQWWYAYYYSNQNNQLLSNLTYGLSAAHTERQAILAAIAALPAGSSLPGPGGYGSDVWGAADASPGLTGVLRGDELSFVTTLAEVTRNQGGVQAMGLDHTWLAGNIDDPSFLNYTWTPPAPDWSAILPADTPFTWLTRTDANTTWVDRGNGYICQGYPNDSPAPPDLLNYWFAMSPRDWSTVISGLPVVAPIWPGIANATLGTPVALAPQVSVTGPLSGVLVAVTTPPALGLYPLGSHSAYYRLGQISFVDDNGQLEPPQPLSLDQALYCPKAMTVASSALLRVRGGAGGLVTPWLHS